MGKIGENNAQNTGGVIDIDSLTRKPLVQAGPKTSAETIAGTIERIVTMPSMQPILEQGARLMSAYAEKIMRENSGGSQRGQQQPERRPVFGAGAKEP